ncbi:MAG: pyridoxamine 5-phosphate oxidase [Gaiellales bacterium]|jgi:pyridoxamine 5'-phosphate oxidase|nr:pyridoxamine 5-phosphate oxidase [Gaiellales bacterium]MDX6544916.1 pyridoxamine 5-phosphate oxidase [Gaiellales bacterium]
MPDADPIALFLEWLAAAEAHGIEQPEAMALATATPDGRPSARMVLLRGADRHGFRFFSNHDSRKGGELAGNPVAALLFHWQSIGRQVRIEGAVSRLADAESDAYFASRPRDSRLSAWASDQSRPVESRDELLGRLEKARTRFAGDEVPRPPYWGGYLLEPCSIEFWQHGPHRLHDRRLYTLSGGGWSSRLLAP